MEPKSPKSQPHNNKQHVPDSHPSVHTVADEFIVQVLTQELETLVLCCEHDGFGFDRDRAFQVSNISVTDDDGDRTEHAVGVESDERCHVAEEVVDVALSDSLRKNCEAVDEVIESGDVEEVVEVDLDECRVLSRDVKDCEKLLYDQVNGTDEKVEKKAKQVEINTGEKVEKKDKQVEMDECRVLEAREIGEKLKGVDEHDEHDDHEDEDVKLEEEVEIVDGEGGDGIGGFEVNGEEGENVGGENDVLKSYHYPLRPDAEDCSYYMRTGMCKYGSNCKFNHPLKRKHQPVKETHKPKEENMEMHGQIECKYYMSPVGCKYGQSCKFSHSRRKPVVTPVTPVLEHNFLGLPIRPGEKECPFYMRNGSCKYGQYCKFNHPDPSAVGDAPTTYGNDGPLPLQPPPGPPQPNIPNLPTWSGPRTPDPTAAFVPVMYPPAQNMPPPNPDWNGYQAPAPVPVPVPAHVYPSSDRGLPIPPAFFMNNPQSDTNMYTHPTHPQQPMMVSEYPERPGQPDCSYYMKTGDCKYRASCKFHHPKSRITRNAPSVLSDKGLPLRPDQNICTHYSRYGICKYGPACKYDHPVNYNMNLIPAGDGYDGSARSGPLIQQSV